MSRNIASCAIAFDMDGVFWKLPNIFDFSKRALNKVISNNIPFIFLTNGGGQPESERLNTFCQRLQMEFNDDSQLILSHTPLKKYFHAYENELVLVSGGRDIYKVGLHYGLKNCVSAGEVLTQHPYLWPFPSIHKIIPLSEDRKLNEDIINFEAKNVSAIAVLHESDCWGSEAQIIVDCLMYADGKENEHIPIHFVNQDTCWTTSYFYPRFAQGIYGGMIHYAYERMSYGKQLSNIVQVGKPTLITYEYAENILAEQAIKCGFSDGVIEEYYMIGDNPEADIAGAHSIGWNSILVETGVYHKGMYDHNPTIIVENVENAIDWICAKHGFNRN